MENLLKPLETQRIMLYFKAMKLFPGSKKQEQLVIQIQEICKKIEEIKNNS